jgi:hypothetical protein
VPGEVLDRAEISVNGARGVVATLQLFQHDLTVMRLRRSTVEHPFATLKYRILGHPRFLLRGLRGTQTEISLAVMAYNLKRMVNILGGHSITAKLQPA